LPKGVAYATRVDSCMCGCGWGACIPQRRYQQGAALHPHERREILFSVNGKCGYLLAGALKKQYTGLDGKDERVFTDFGPTANIILEVRPPASA